MFAKIGHFSTRYRYPVIVFWVAAVILVTLLAPNLSEVTISEQSSYLSSSAPSIVAASIARQYFPEQANPSRTVIVLFNENGSVLGNYSEYIRGLADWLRNDLDASVIDQVLAPTDSPSLESRMVSADGKVAILTVTLNGSLESTAVTNAMRQMSEKLTHAPAGLAAYPTGGMAIANDYKNNALGSAEKTTLITIILVVVILLIIYRSPVLPLVPLITIGAAYAITRGLVASLTLLGWKVSSTTDVFLVVLLFGAGTDYCLFIVSRFREFMADQIPGPESARRTIARVGETIASGAGTVIVGTVAMSFVELKLFATSGPSLGIGVFVALVAGLTFTPALLAVLGERAFWPGKPRHAATGALWGRLAGWVAARPWLPLTIGLALLTPLAIYGQNPRLSFDLLADLPDDIPSKAGFIVLAEHFGAGEMQPLDVIVTEAGDTRSPQGFSAAAALTQQILALEGVEDVRSIALPAGKNSPELGNALRVDAQLNQIADGIAGMGDPAAASGAASAGDISALLGLQTYLAELGAAFPQVASTPEYAAAAGAFADLQTGIQSLLQNIPLSVQLELIAGLFESAAENPLSLAPAAGQSASSGQIATLKTYLAGLGSAFPELAATTDYALAQETIESLENELANINIQTLETVRPLLTALSQSFHSLAAYTAEHLPEAVYTPAGDFSESLDLSSLGGDALAALTPEQLNQMGVGQLLESVRALETPLRALAAVFSARPDAYFAPLSLTGGEQKAGLETLLNTYASANGEAARLQVILRDEPYSPAAIAAVQRLRALVEQGSHGYVSGSTAILTDLRDAMARDMVKMMYLVLGGIAIVLVLLLRSLVAPLYLILTILLSYGATMGVTRLVFEGILHMDLTWFVSFFIFTMLMSLGMDYNIFLMGRVKEEAFAPGALPGTRSGTRPGVRRAMERTGGIITSAGVIMAGTFAAMMASSLVGLVQLSFAITIGVLLDTFIIRTTLVPAIAHLLDRWNWWPGKGPGD